MAMEDRTDVSDIIQMDCLAEATRLEGSVKESVLGRMRKKGVVIGLSGGLDSSVCASICVNAIGKNKVLGLFMPERETKDDTNRLGSLMADHLEIDTITEDMTSLLESAGCYARRDRAIREIFEGYSEGWKCKVFLPPITENDRLNVSQLVVQSPEGNVQKKRMTTSAYLTIIASSNFKQRTRKMMEYYHADRLNYAVVGTPNRLEYELGFFVKNGDGAADLKPIAHLYKSEVYQLA
jgi:NAD+ synthase